MAEHTTLEFSDVVQALLNEDQLFSLRERRHNSRKSFVRPVTLFLGSPAKRESGFTRDLSNEGLGLIHKFSVEAGEQALVTVHRLWDEPFILRCEACWCEEVQHGWQHSGWRIISVESALPR